MEPGCAKGALPVPAPAGASSASALSTQPPRGLQGRLRDPGLRALLFGPFPAPPLLGVWCPQPWAYCRGPSCHCGHSLCLQFRELDKEIRKTFKQILSSSPSFIALTPQEFTPPWRSAHGSSAPSAGFTVCAHKGVCTCTPHTQQTHVQTCTRPRGAHQASSGHLMLSCAVGFLCGRCLRGLSGQTFSSLCVSYLNKSLAPPGRDVSWFKLIGPSLRRGPLSVPISSRARGPQMSG